MSLLAPHQLRSIDITQVKGIGSTRAEALNRLGIASLYDLLFFYPREYEDTGRTLTISQVTLGEKYRLVGEVVKLRESYARGRRGLIITKAVLRDQTGEIGLLWFQQKLPTPTPICRKLERGGQIQVYGRVEEDRGYLVLKNPEVEFAERTDSLHLGRITPIYPLTEGVNQKVLRRNIRSALDQFRDDLVDPLPEALRAKEELLSLGAALEELHYPTQKSRAEEARKRLAFDRLLAFGLELQLSRIHRAPNGIRHSSPGQLIQGFLADLPFTPTGAQQRAIGQIWQEMQEPYQMEHLLMGDVGSGKTLVATMAILKSIEDGYQAAVMAPTGILARQHYESISGYFTGLPVKIRLLLGDTPPKERQEILAELSDGRCHLIVGTHALIQEEVSFLNLGLAVTDEQHRFGVSQREMLKTKGQTPDILVISATPIPRTLALTAYGELGYSILDEAPPGRKKVITKWVDNNRLSRVWDFVKQEAAQGFSAYVVCALVDENPDLAGVRGVLQLSEELKEGPLSELRLAVLHGGMSEEEKASVLSRFKAGKLDVVVSTTVVEIGVDVPTASSMIIMNAERFGLAQLHQLRGRVGRGRRQSYCILCSESTSELAVQRLRTMEEVASGQEIAEVDLRLRGPGEVFGLRQHGTEDLIFQTMLHHPEIYERAFALASQAVNGRLAILGEEVWHAYHLWFGPRDTPQGP